MLNIQLEKKELPFAMAEEIKNLRTGISFSGENLKTILFTSCTPNEGKSTIALETVKSFAELGKKALYLDCDLRKSLFDRRVVSGKAKHGLTHYLTGQCKLEDIIYKNEDSEDDFSYYLVPAGPASNSAAELIASDKFASTLKTLRKDYDIIIIDTPPLASVGDAAIIGAIADGSVFVIEAGNVDYRLVQKVRDKLVTSGSRILGVVLNKVDKANNHYGYYKYGKEYGYYSYSK